MVIPRISQDRHPSLSRCTRPGSRGRSLQVPASRAQHCSCPFRSGTASDLMRFKAVSSATGIRQVMVSKDLLQLQYWGRSDGIALTRCAHPRPRTRMDAPFRLRSRIGPGHDPGQRATDAARVSRSKVHARPPCSEKGVSAAFAAGAKESYARISHINRDREGWRGWMAVCAYLPAFVQAPGGGLAHPKC